MLIICSGLGVLTKIVISVNKIKSNDYFDFIFEEDILKEFETFLHDSGIDNNLTVKTDHDGIKRLCFDTDVRYRFLRLLQAERKRFIHSFIGIRPPRMYRLCLLMNLMPFTIMSWQRVL